MSLNWRAEAALSNTEMWDDLAREVILQAIAVERDNLPLAKALLRDLWQLAHKYANEQREIFNREYRQPRRTTL